MRNPHDACMTNHDHMFVDGVIVDELEKELKVATY